MKVTDRYDVDIGDLRMNANGIWRSLVIVFDVSNPKRAPAYVGSGYVSFGSDKPDEKALAEAALAAAEVHIRAAEGEDA